MDARSSSSPLWGRRNPNVRDDLLVVQTKSLAGLGHGDLRRRPAPYRDDAHVRGEAEPLQNSGIRLLVDDQAVDELESRTDRAEAREVSVDLGVAGPVKGDHDGPVIQLAPDNAGEPFQLVEAEVELDVDHVGIEEMQSDVELVELRTPAADPVPYNACLEVGVDDLRLLFGEDLERDAVSRTGDDLVRILGDTATRIPRRDHRDVWYVCQIFQVGDKTVEPAGDGIPSELGPYQLARSANPLFDLGSIRVGVHEPHFDCELLRVGFSPHGVRYVEVSLPRIRDGKEWSLRCGPR